ncbi:MAG: hypothetical protein AB2392_05800 [Neobacillus sp.]|jgi:multisubunit Na+/H+ antiporter MnhB subunit
MNVGIIIAIVFLLVYVIVLIRDKKVTKKERRTAYVLVLMVLGLSFLFMLHIPMNFIITFLNDTFGAISRMVVKV